jgi:RNA polymerase sigma-70 factor (ECF subfamily)
MGKDVTQPAESRPCEPTDLDLLRRAGQGDMAAFHQLVDRRAGELYRLAVSLGCRKEDAEDALQETLAAAFRQAGSFRAEASPRTWLAQILVRQVAGQFRRLRLHPSLQDDAHGEQVAPARQSAFAGQDARLDVQAALEALSPEQRQAIVLREMERMSYAEIAQVLQVPQGTVESRLHRARRRLAELLKDYLA